MRHEVENDCTGEAQQINRLTYPSTRWEHGEAITTVRKYALNQPRQYHLPVFIIKPALWKCSSQSCCSAGPPCSARCCLSTSFVTQRLSPARARTRCGWTYTKRYTVYRRSNKFNINRNIPITVAARSNAWTASAHSNTRIVVSFPTRGMYVCVFILYVGTGLSTGSSPVRGVLLTV
jgi:hypothetical protein